MQDDKLAERNEKDLEKNGPHPEKHAKDPEDARGLVLSIATVVFKQKVTELCFPRLHLLDAYSS